jgi:mRNA interferase MazF
VEIKMNTLNPAPVRGSIFYADFGYGENGEQNGIRPVLVIQNDIGNQYSPTIIVAAISSKVKRLDMPTHITVEPTEQNGLLERSIVVLEQIRTISKDRLMDYVGIMNKEVMEKINKAIFVSVGISYSDWHEFCRC